MKGRTIPGREGNHWSENLVRHRSELRPEKTPFYDIVMRAGELVSAV